MRQEDGSGRQWRTRWIPGYVPPTSNAQARFKETAREHAVIPPAPQALETTDKENEATCFAEIEIRYRELRPPTDGSRP